MDDTKSPNPQELAQQLAAIEDLLKQQVQQNKKIAKHRGILSALMLCLVVVFAVGLFALNQTVANATRELPQLIESTNRSAQQLQVTLKDVSSIDFESLNDTIEDMGDGVAAMDFETLNKAVLDLQKAAEGLANLTKIFR